MKGSIKAGIGKIRISNSKKIVYILFFNLREGIEKVLKIISHLND